MNQYRMENRKKMIKYVPFFAFFFLTNCNSKIKMHARETLVQLD